MNQLVEHIKNFLKHIDQSLRFADEQRQNLIDDLKDIDRRREQATSAIEAYLREADDSEKQSEAFKVLEEIEQDLDMSLANQINAEIMHR